MKTKICYFTIIVFCMPFCLLGQQDPYYNFYAYNMNLINPAYAGSSENIDVTLAIRSQWVGLEGAPEGQSAIFGMPVGENLGLGISILNDKTFIERQTWLAVDFSYNLMLSRRTSLYLGIKASGNTYNANTKGLITYGFGQDAVLGNVRNGFSPNVGVGAYIKHDTYFLSFSIPKILTPDRLEQEGNNVYLGRDKRHMYLSGGYDFVFSRNTNLRAMAMLRYVDAAPISLEITSILDLGDYLGLGASYRINQSFVGLFIFKVSSSFQLGYAYEFPIQESIGSFNNSTHELMLSLKL